MKRTPLIIIVIVLFTMLSAVQCIKDKPWTPPTELPPITQEGKGTLGFMLNDKVWVPYVQCKSGSYRCEIYLNSSDISFSLRAQIKYRNDDAEQISFETSFRPIRTTGEKRDSLSIEYTNREGFRFNRPGKINSFIITKLDPVNKIIAGTFNLTLYSTADSVRITEGRFDLPFDGCKCSK